MDPAAVSLRPARPDDCRLVFDWANDPATRAASFHSEVIAFEDHARWYEGSLGGTRRYLRIAELDAAPVGLVRFDRLDADETRAEIGINLAPEHRGRRLAVPILLAATEEASALGLRTVVARIRPENAPSIRAFERAGYRFVAEERVSGFEAFRYEAVIP